MKIKTWCIIESNPTIIFQFQYCVFIWSLLSLVISKISMLHAWFATSLLASSQSKRVPWNPMKLQKNWWNKFVLLDSLCYTVKEGNIKASTSPVKLSAFISLRDACNEHYIFLPWLFLIPQRNLTKADFDHVLGNHFWTVSHASHNQQNNALTFVKLYFMETAFIAWTEWNWSPFNKLWL